MKRRRHLKYSLRSRRTAGTITLYHQRIPRAKFDALPEAERYCFLLLGHIHDELSWLQRMAFVASNAENKGGDIEKAGNMMQATLLARLLLGKLFEFKKVMAVENSPIPQFITDYFDPADNSIGAAQVNTILDYYAQERWIRVARNKHFLHYPEMSDVTATLNDPQIEWHPEVVHGAKSGNTFYPTSDVMANYAWFRLANPQQPMVGFNEALSTIRELARLSLSTLERSIGHFIDTKLMDLSDNEKVKLSVAASIYDVKLHYFVKT